jgi:hypothetical protein
MPGERRELKRWGVGLIVVFLASGAGCLKFVHPVPPPTPEQAAPCAAVPELARNHVHIFFIHGMDPCDLANLEGMSDYVQSLGFLKTHYGQLYHTWKFRDDVRRVHDEDADARFVLIGFSFGANMVRNLANMVKDDGIIIDLLVYLGGNTLENTPPNRPEHCLHIVNILATGCIWNGATLDGAQNIQYTNVWHFGSPTHPGTREMLCRELALVAERVPIYVSAHEELMPLEEAPRPQPLPSRLPAESRSEESGDWNFLDSQQAPALPAPRQLKFQRPSSTYHPPTPLPAPSDAPKAPPPAPVPPGPVPDRGT